MYSYFSKQIFFVHDVSVLSIEAHGQRRYPAPIRHAHLHKFDNPLPEGIAIYTTFPFNKNNGLQEF